MWAPKTCGPVKAGGDRADDFFRTHPRIRYATNADVGGLLARHPLVGGTAWLFCREELTGRLDYLFVDEAGASAAGQPRRDGALVKEPRVGG